jgi:hypothetical protein
VTASRRAGRRLAAAQERVEHLRGADTQTWSEAFDELRRAERELAAARGEQYADVLDIGAAWDMGAPLPHLLVGPHSAYIVCHAHDADPHWDRTSVTMRSPADEDAGHLLLIEIVGCQNIRMGGPNDEALHGHALHGRGLSGYQAHEVRNSEWLESAVRVNSVHPNHSEAPFRQLQHYVLPFHDEMIEALGRGIRVTHVAGTIRGILTDLVGRITPGD